MESSFQLMIAYMFYYIKFTVIWCYNGVFASSTDRHLKSSVWNWLKFSEFVSLGLYFRYVKLQQCIFLSFRVKDKNNQICYIHRFSVTAELCFYYHDLQCFDLGYNDLATHQLSLTCVGRW